MLEATGIDVGGEKLVGLCSFKQSQASLIISIAISNNVEDIARFAQYINDF